MKTQGNITLLADPVYLRRQSRFDAIQRHKRKGLGYLGDGAPAQAPATGAGYGAGLISAAGAVASFLPAGSQAQKSVSLTAEGASTGAVIGSVVPGIGTVVGAVVGAFVGAVGSFFGPAKEGQAALTWDNMVHTGGLTSHAGHEFDERYWAESFKGMMDENGDVFPSCGSNGHKNPDCFTQPLARVIINGYLNRQVPLTANVEQVYSAVVQPWLKTSASGVNWNRLVSLANQQKMPRSLQELMIKSAVDRYLYGQPITRANMGAYSAFHSQYAAYDTPGVLTALQSILPKAATPAQQAQQPTMTTQPVQQTVPVPKPSAAPPAISSTAPSAMPFSSYPLAQWLQWAQSADPTGALLAAGNPQSGYLWGPNSAQVQVSGIPSNFWATFLSMVTPYTSSQPTPMTYQAAAPIPYSAPASDTNAVSYAPVQVAHPSSPSTQSVLLLGLGAALLFTVLRKK